MQAVLLRAGFLRVDHSVVGLLVPAGSSQVPKEDATRPSDGIVGIVGIRVERFLCDPFPILIIACALFCVVWYLLPTKPWPDVMIRRVCHVRVLSVFVSDKYAPEPLIQEQPFVDDELVLCLRRDSRQVGIRTTEGRVLVCGIPVNAFVASEDDPVEITVPPIFLFPLDGAGDLADETPLDTGRITTFGQGRRPQGSWSERVPIYVDLTARKSAPLLP